MAAACLGLATFSATAQEDDRGRLIGFLEDQLSDGDDRQVRIDGFRGALSSEASLDRLAVSDPDGEWLILEDVVLDWNRSALLRGRLEVTALTAERLSVLRAPLPPVDQVDLPSPEATPFSLPDIPLDIRIDQVAIARVDLGEPLLGQEASLSLDGQARLADGSGSADIELRRIDGPAGRFSLMAGFDNATRVLDIDLTLAEAPDGLAATLLNIPGTPDLRLEVAGEGPLDDILVDISLATDGQDRVTGSVRSAQIADGAGQRIDVDLSGDLTPLMAAEYHPFFGTDSALTATVEQNTDGATTLRDLRLASAALDLSGDVALDPVGRPEAFDVVARIANPEGAGPVRLPAASLVELQSADMAITFDAATGDNFTVEATVDALSTEDLDIGRAVLSAEGRIVPSASGVGAVSAAVTAALDDLRHDDPTLAEALGSQITLDTQVDWAEGEDLRLTDLTLASGSVTAAGQIAAGIGEGALPLSFDVAAEIADIARFSTLAGQPLSGALEARFGGTAEPLSGAFDITLDGRAQDLALGTAVPRALLAGETTLRTNIIRDTEGTRLETLDVDGTQISLSASGDLSSEDGTLTAQARLADLGLFTDTIRGPASATAEVTRMGEGWDVDADLQGPVGLRAALDGRVGLPNGAVDLGVTGSAPLALANQFIAPRSVAGTLTFDLAMRGAPSLGALSGQLSTRGARLSAPTLQVALTDLGLTANLSGGRLSLDGGGSVSSGGRVSLNGNLDIGQGGLPGTINVGLDAVRLIDPSLYEVLVSRGDITVSGALARGPLVSGQITLGESELRVPEAGLGSAAPIPEIRHIGETVPQRRTRAAAGLTGSGNGGGGSGGSAATGLDLTISAPGRIFLRGRGIDAEFGGQIRVGGTTAQVIPAGRFDLVRGRISILGTRLDITEGSATLQGDFDPFLRLRAESRAGEYRIIIGVDGPASSPDITFSSDPFLPQDEVLAQLLFGRSVSALSPVQLVQLADAATSLAGGSTSGGILSNLREGLGLDDLDIATDAEGNAAVRAGRYLSDNIYTDVTVGAGGTSDLSLNIDLTPNVTARGSVSSDGSSALGVFFERDY